MATNNSSISYRKRSLAYLGNTMYKDIATTQNSPGNNLFYSDNLDLEIKPNFNAVRKLIQVTGSLAMNGNIKIVNDENGIVSSLCNYNKLNSKKNSWVEELLIGKKIFIEAKKNEENGLVDWTLHNSDVVKYVEDSKGDLFQVKINIKEYEYDPKVDIVKKVDYIKTYTKLKTGNIMMSLNDASGKRISSETLELDKLPVIKIDTEYDLNRSFQIIDDFNELNVYINAIFKYAGEPLLSATGVRGLSDDSQEQIKADSYKAKKVILSGHDTDLKILELKGTSAKSMLDKQELLKVNLTDEYPEYGMSSVLSGSNVSTDTMRLRMTDILAKVNNLRLSFTDGVTNLIEISAKLLGVELTGTIELPEVFVDDKLTRLKIVGEATKLEKMSDESAMVLLSDIYLDGSVENEIKRIESEGADLNDLKGVTTNTEINSDENIGS